MKKKIIFAFIFFFLVVITYIFIGKNIDNSNSQFLRKIKLMIPYDIRQAIKKNVFVYSYIDILENKIAKKEKNLIDLSYKFTSIHGMYFQRLIDNEIILSKNKKKFYYSELKTEMLPWQGPHGYFDLFEKNIFIISHKGIINYGNKGLLKYKNFSLNTIPSNLSELVNYKKFFGHKHYGVKGLLVDNNQVYVSLIYELKKGCYNLSIFVAELNFENLDYKKFFSPNTCVNENDEYYKIANERLQPLQSGGAMTKTNNNKIIFSTGEFRLRDLAQDKESVFGKIIEIDRESKKFRIISMGHRNPQGIYYNQEKNILLSTEHSAQGGDEININPSIEEEKIKNYGWPISSYGEHYGFDTRDDSSVLYEIAPLNKSHKNFGFIEPLKYFDLKARAPSAIAEINKNLKNLDGNQYMVSLMKYRQLHHIKLNDNHDKILSHDIIQFKNRIRDIKYDEETEKTLLLFEKDTFDYEEEYAYWIGVLEPIN